MQVVGAEYQPHIPVIPADLLDHVLLLHHAAAQTDHHARILLPVCRQRSQAPVDTDIGILPDGAGVVEDKVSVLGRALLIACKLQDPAKLLGVPLIHLASEGYNTGGQLSSKLFFLPGYQLPCPVDEPGLSKRAVLLGRLVHGPGCTQHLPEFFRFKNCSVFHQCNNPSFVKNRAISSPLGSLSISLLVIPRSATSATA